MRVIFIRHGQTDLGARFRFQSQTTPLSARGSATTRSFASALHIEGKNTKIYTGNYRRSIETATIIAEIIGAQRPEIMALMGDKNNGTAVLGHSYFSFAFLQLAFATLKGAINGRYRSHDEETMEELIKRVVKARLFIESVSGAYDTIVVVSHALTISAFMECIHPIPTSRVGRFFSHTKIISRAFLVPHLATYLFSYDSRQKIWSKGLV